MKGLIAFAKGFHKWAGIEIIVTLVVAAYGIEKNYIPGNLINEAIMAKAALIACIILLFYWGLETVYAVHAWQEAETRGSEEARKLFKRLLWKMVSLTMPVIAISMITS